MKFDLKKLCELTAIEVTTIFQERIRVFVVEQNCPYQEIDEHDSLALHLRLLDESNELIAYARIFEEVDYVSFGRVLVKKEFRKNNYGRELIAKVLEIIDSSFPNKKIQISAQLYLLNFYKQLGFTEISNPYLEDNIPHIDMLFLKASLNSH